MEIPSNLLSLLCLLPLSPIAWICVGWMILSIVVGVRGGLEAGFRLFLLGLGLLLAVAALGAILFYLPDWASIAALSIVALAPWISTLRYFIASRCSGRLLMALPSRNEKWSISIMSGAFSILLALPGLIFHDNDLLSPAKSYAIGICLISLGVFRALERIRYTQIREKGILSERGGFYRWDNIDNYGWKFGEDKLSLKLKKALLRTNVNLKILSQFRREVVAHLSQHVSIQESNTEGYTPVKKVG